MKLALLVLLSTSLIGKYSFAAHKRVPESSRDIKTFPREAVASSAPIDCSKVPPAFWCANSDLASKCGFDTLCKRYSDSTKNKKLQFTLFYESLCPDCQEFMLGTFYRDVYLNFGDYIDFELVPYGNAKIQDGKIVCQHGEKECEINKYEGCVLHYMKEPIPFIICLESRIQDGSSLQKAAEKCYYTFRVGPHVADQIIHCAASETGDKFQREAAARTDQSWPDKHRFVPWVLFNNVSIENYQFLLGGLPTAICEFYNGDKVPGHCHGLGMTFSTFVSGERKRLTGCMRDP